MTTETFNVQTAGGAVHRLTSGRTYRSSGSTFANDSRKSSGKANCGTRTSSAARVTTSPVTCTKCLTA